MGDQLMTQEFLDEHELALALARNALGMQLPVADLLKQLGIDPKTLLRLSKSEAFTSMVKQYRAELEKDGEGIRLKSAVALEHSIPRLYALIHNHDTPGNVVVQGVKQLADMADINKRSQEVAPGTGFQVNIDLSGLAQLNNPANITSTTLNPPPASASVIIDVNETGSSHEPEK